MNYKNKKVLVYGLGASGRSVIKLLQKIGADVYVFDDDINEKEIPKNVMPNEVFYNNVTEEPVQDADDL